MLRRMSARGSFLSLFDLLRNLSPCGRVGQSPIKGARLDYSTIAVSYRQLPLTRHRVGIVILRYPRPASRHGFTPLAGQFRYSRIKTVVVDRLVLIQGEADVRRIFGVRVTVSKNQKRPCSEHEDSQWMPSLQSAWILALVAYAARTYYPRGLQAARPLGETSQQAAPDARPGLTDNQAAFFRSAGFRYLPV